MYVMGWVRGFVLFKPTIPIFFVNEKETNLTSTEVFMLNDRGFKLETLGEKT